MSFYKSLIYAYKPTIKHIYKICFNGVIIIVFNNYHKIKKFQFIPFGKEFHLDNH